MLKYQLCIKDIVICLSLLLLSAYNNPASAQTFASVERHNIAIGHYARARALLVEALAEFEEGRHVAQPDLLLDTERWRSSVISRTEELNRLLDPQPRVTRSGVQFKANSALIRRDRTVSKSPEDYPQGSNQISEKAYKGLSSKKGFSSVSIIKDRARLAPNTLKRTLGNTKTVTPKASKTQDIEFAAKSESSDISKNDTESEAGLQADENDPAAKFIEQAINARIEKLRLNEKKNVENE